jgi:hypothetical protein
MWKLDQPESELWNTLTTILSLGGSFELDGREKIFTAPYVTSRWPDRFDVFDYAAAVKKNVQVRREPQAEAPIIATLSYDIVKVEYQQTQLSDQSQANEWLKIITPSGKQGYVLAQEMRSAVDYRARFKKRNGKWRMTALIAGD